MTDDNYNRYEEPAVCNHYNYKLEGDILYLREDSFRDKNLITTPGRIVKDMLDLLPDSVWNTETTFLIPCIKSGNFAIEVKNRLLNCKDAIERFPDYVDRRDHIDSKQLFCIYWYTEEEFNKNLISGHIWGVNGLSEALDSSYVNLICTDDLNFETFKDKTGKKQEKLLESIKETFGTVKFDVVIGNPPYNNDLYIDFVTWGHQRANKYSLWITPAKWQAKGGDKNERFRKDIVPYMKDIVYYPDAFEIFDIREQEGITYYAVDKNIHDAKEIKCICNSNNTFSSDVENRRNIMQTLFSNKIANIIDKCKSNTYMSQVIGVKQSEYVSNTEHGNSTGDIEIYAGEKLSGYINKSQLRTTEDLDKYKVSTSVMPVDVGFDNDGKLFGLSRTYIVKPNAVPKGSFPVLMKFSTFKEAESFRSYCNTILVRFLYYIGICGKTISEEFWRFVPCQGAFDHIFTDEELYNKYGLTQDEINLIESVIKSRK